MTSRSGHEWYDSPVVRELLTIAILVILLHILCTHILPWLKYKIYPQLNPPSPFSKLPPELLLSIIYQCPPTTQAVLASTSKDFYEATKRWHSVKRINLSARERAEAVFALAKDLPDKAPCWDCGRLHEIDITDTPLPPRFCFDQNVRFTRHYCSITPTHVALALKFHRLGIQSEYLSRLMRPQYTQKVATITLEMVILTQPRIANGRFLLHITFEDLIHCFYDIWPCEHIKLRFPYRRRGREPRLDWPNDSPPDADDPDAPVGFSTSCRKCRIYIEVTAYRHRWLMDMWMDLGTETREGLCDDKLSMGSFARPVPNPIDRCTGRWVPHEMGSIKRLWESAKSWDGEELRLSSYVWRSCVCWKGL